NGRAQLSREQLEPYRIAGVSCQLVFVNGRFARSLSLFNSLPAGVKVSNLAGEISSYPGTIEPHLGRYLDIHCDAFCVLNTAFAEAAAFVHILRATVREARICLLSAS